MELRKKIAPSKIASKLLRKRKTADPCGVCFLHKSRCICEFIPKHQLETKVTLVIHRKELKRTTNTGRLAIKALLNSAMIVRGHKEKALDLSQLIDPNYRTFLLYPSDDALDLTTELVKSQDKPIHLIVPDGNWRQASKVHYRHTELADVPRVKLPAESEAAPIRKESKEQGMATLEAIACALGVIEGEAVKTSLLTLYNKKRENTLKGRGLLREKPKMVTHSESMS